MVHSLKKVVVVCVVVVGAAGVERAANAQSDGGIDAVQTQANIAPSLVPALAPPAPPVDGGDWTGVRMDSITPPGFDVSTGCIQAGQHEVLRFSLETENAGTRDFHVDPTTDRSAYRQLQSGFNLLTDFAKFWLIDTSSRATVAEGKKEYFSLESDYAIPYMVSASSPLPSAPSQADQGPRTPAGTEFLSWGYYDDYDLRSPCEYIVVDGLGNGTYDLVVDENAPLSVSCGPRNDVNCTFDGRAYDNTTAMRVQIAGCPANCAVVTNPDASWPQPTVDATATAIGPVQISGAPAVVSHGVNTYDLFYVGSDGGLYTLSQGATGSWPASGTAGTLISNAYALSGPVVGVTVDDKRTDLLAETTAGDVVLFSWDGTTWQSSIYGAANQNMGAAAPPALVASGPHSAMAAWLGPSGQVNYGVFGPSGWAAPQTLPHWNFVSQTPALASDGDGMFHLFVHDGYGQKIVYNRYANGSWLATGKILWNQVFAPVTGNLTAVSPFLNRVDVFSRTTDNRLIRNTWTGIGDSFLGWTDDIASTPDCVFANQPTTRTCSSFDYFVGSSPVAISTGLQKFDVFFYDPYANKQDTLFRLHFDGTIPPSPTVPPTQTPPVAAPWTWTLQNVGRLDGGTPTWPIVVSSWSDNTFDLFQEFQPGQIGVRSMR